MNIESTKLARGSGYALLVLWLLSFMLGTLYAFAYLGESLLAADYWVYSSVALAVVFLLLTLTIPFNTDLPVNSEWLAAFLLGLNIFATLYLRVEPSYVSLLWLPVMFFSLRHTRIAVPAFAASWVGICSYLVANDSGYLVEGSGADMLAMIKAGSEVFLEGVNPHGMHFDEITKYPFMYLPAIWLPYVPFVAYDLDMRLLNLIVLALVTLSVVVRFNSTKDPVSLAVLLVLTSPVISLLVMKGQVWPYWLLCWLFAIAASRGSVLLAAGLLGLMLASRQWALLFLTGFPFYLLRTRGWVSTLRAGGVTLVVFVLITLPFFIWDSSLFEVTYLDPMREVHHNFTYKFAMTTVLNHFDALELKSLLFVAVLIVSAVWVALARSDSESVWRAGLSFVAAVAFNTKVHPYYYVSGLLVAGAALHYYAQTWRLRDQS
jgi:hypothetical protein